MIEAVAALVEQVAAEVLSGPVEGLREKSPGEPVTDADEALERLLVAGLHALAPGVPVLAEEAASTDPALLGLLQEPGPLWVVDPLDGTAALAAGSPDHAVLVALLQDGETVAAVVHQPAHGRTLLAERGAGAWEGGRRLVVRPPADPVPAVLGRFLPPEVREAVHAAVGAAPPPNTCAGVLYPAVLDGRLDPLLFWRTLPWDHAAGALLVTEAGGRAVRPDGRAYRPGTPGQGLVVTGGDPEAARRLLGLLEDRAPG